MHFWALVVAGLIWAATTSLAAAQGTPTPQPDPSGVVEAFQSARAAGNLEAALAQFADTAVVVVQGRSTETFSGQARLRAYMQTVAMSPDNVIRSRPTVQGNSVTWIERDQFAGQSVDATVVAVVNSGHIISLTYHNNQTAMVGGTLARGASDQPIQIPSAIWPASLVLLSGGMLGFVFGRPRRRASRSRLHGRLMLELRRGRALD